MSKDNIEDFLKNLGMKKQPENKPQAQNGQWGKVIQPNSSYLIVGDVGAGKSALAYWLLETFGKKYDLLPTVVGFPRDKQALLPPGFVVKDSPEELNRCENAIVFIDEADLQLPLEDTKAREYVVNFLSLPRHRHQIFLLAFHFPRLVLGRYLPFFGAFLLKRPPYLIEFASKSKNDALSQMMTRAEERFGEMPSEEDIKSHTYVVAPRIRWQGMLVNPLCSFWTQELSEIWAGTEVARTNAKQSDMFGKTNVRQPYAHLPPSQILDLCLACARLDNAAYNKIWKPKHQSFMDKLTGKADEYNLHFATSDLDLRGWVIRRVQEGSKCVMATKQSCPCSNPLAAGCPVLRGTQR